MLANSFLKGLNSQVPREWHSHQNLPLSYEHQEHLPEPKQYERGYPIPNQPLHSHTLKKHETHSWDGQTCQDHLPAKLPALQSPLISKRHGEPVWGDFHPLSDSYITIKGTIQLTQGSDRQLTVGFFNSCTSDRRSLLRVRQLMSLIGIHNHYNIVLRSGDTKSY